MKNMTVSAKLKKNKSNLVEDLKRRNLQSRFTAIVALLKKANVTDTKFIIKNFTDEVNILMKNKGHIAKSVTVYKKLSKLSKKAK